MENSELHKILNSFDKKANIFIVILSAFLGLSKYIFPTQIMLKVFYPLISIPLILMLLIVAPWFVGKNINSKYNIWNLWKKRKNNEENDEMKYELAKLIKIKWILFWIAIIFIIITIITMVILGAIYA